MRSMEINPSQANNIPIQKYKLKHTWISISTDQTESFETIKAIEVSMVCVDLREQNHTHFLSNHD